MTSTTTSTSTSTTSTTPPPLGYFFDGFEGGDMSNWDDSEGVSVISYNTFQDSYSALIDCTASDIDDWQYFCQGYVFNEMNMRMVFYLTELPQAGFKKDLMWLYSNQVDYGVYVSIWNDGGTYFLVIEDGYDYNSSELAGFTVDTWHQLEVLLVIGGFGPGSPYYLAAEVEKYNGTVLELHYDPSECSYFSYFDVMSRPERIMEIPGPM